MTFMSGIAISKQSQPEYPAFENIFQNGTNATRQKIIRKRSSGRPSIAPPWGIDRADCSSYAARVDADNPQRCDYFGRVHQTLRLTPRWKRASPIMSGALKRSWPSYRPNEAGPLRNSKAVNLPLVKPTRTQLNDVGLPPFMVIVPGPFMSTTMPSAV
jgi:hypothetical protein